MMQTINISDSKKLLSIIDVIHDCRFDKEKISFDHEASVLKIDFYREAWEQRKIIRNFWIFKKVRVPVKLCILKILHVESYQIQEGSQTGPGSDDFFNILTYDKDRKQIWISAVISKGIIIRVKELELSLEETETVTEEKTCYTIFG